MIRNTDASASLRDLNVAGGDLALVGGKGCQDPAEPSTLRQYRTHIDQHIVPEFVGVRLSDLTAARVRGFRDHLLRSTSRPMAKKVLTSFKSILREAKSRDLLASDPASGVTIVGSGSGRHRKEVVIPEKAEIASVLAKLGELASQSNKQRAKAWRRWQALLVTAIDTGFRASELRGLPWDGVDLKDGKATVKQRADENGDLGSPKSGSSLRTLDIPKRLVAILRQWKLECPPGPLVFPNWQGNVESLANIHNRCWKPLQLAAGLSVTAKDEEGKTIRDDRGKPVKVPKYNFHALRHFHASLLIDDGANPKEVQVEMGHATITVTYDLYGHLFKDEAADKIRKARAERLATALA